MFERGDAPRSGEQIWGASAIQGFGGSIGLRSHGETPGCAARQDPYAQPSLPAVTEPAIFTTPATDVTEVIKALDRPSHLFAAMQQTRRLRAEERQSTIEVKTSDRGVKAKPTRGEKSKVDEALGRSSAMLDAMQARRRQREAMALMEVPPDVEGMPDIEHRPGS